MRLNTPTILPANSTDTEKQLTDIAWRLNSPPDIASVMDSAAIPSELLPWLAWAQSVDVWNSTEAEDVKRASVLTSADFHRMKGTVEGFRRLCALFGATLAGVVRPPNKTFCGKSYTRAERDAMLAVYPQLRIRTQAQPGKRIALGVYCHNDYLGATPGTWDASSTTWDEASGQWDDAAPADSGVHAKRFLVRTDAAARMLPQAYYYDRGSETQLATYNTTLDGQGYIRICVTATRKYATFCGSFPRYLSNCGAEKRIYSLNTTYEQSSSARWKTLLPGLDPVSVYPELRFETSKRAGVFCGPRHGASFIGQYLVRSDAENRIYKRIYLFDSTRALEARGKTTYLGAMRLGMPAYTAELRVLWSDRRPARAVSRYVNGYLVRSDHELFNRFIAALAWAKPARDKLLLDTYSYKPLTAGEIHTAGTELVCGQLVKRF